jgi:hypothetical protein
VSNVRAVTAVENVRQRLIGIVLKFRAVPRCYSSHRTPDASPRHFRRWKSAPYRASKDKEQDLDMSEHARRRRLPWNTEIM